jgi:hypothetical protein
LFFNLTSNGFGCGLEVQLKSKNMESLCLTEVFHQKVFKCFFGQFFCSYDWIEFPWGPTQTTCLIMYNVPRFFRYKCMIIRFEDLSVNNWIKKKTGEFRQLLTALGNEKSSKSSLDSILTRKYWISFGKNALSMFVRMLLSYRTIITQMRRNSRSC